MAQIMPSAGGLPCVLFLFLKTHPCLIRPWSQAGSPQALLHLLLGLGLSSSTRAGDLPLVFLFSLLFSLSLLQRVLMRPG